MNKKNMIIMAGLMFSFATAMPSVGKKERSIVYTMKTLGQDLSQQPLIVQNIDMFIPLFEMNININEKELQNFNIKSTLAKSAAAIGGIAGINHYVPVTLGKIRPRLFGDSWHDTPNAFYSIQDSLNVFTRYACSIATTCVALNLYDAFKTRNELQKSLALDKQILVELIEIKEFMVFQGSDDATAQQAEISLI